MRIKNKALYYFCFVLFTTVLAIFFYKDTFHTLDEVKLEKRQCKECQSLVVGRFLAAENEGVLSYSGFPGIYNFGRTTNICEDTLDYNAYIAQKPINNAKFEVYMSQIGGNGMIQSIIEQILPFEKQTNYNFLQFLQAFLLAFMIMLFLQWIYFQFGWISALVPYIILAFSSWLVYLSSNIWFSIWTYYLPFIYFLYYVQKRINSKNEISLKNLFAHAVFILSIKIFLTGFEYITTILITTALPFFYFYFLKDFSSKKYTKIFNYTGIIALAFVVVFVGNLLIMSWQTHSLGSNLTAIEHIFNRLNERTQGQYVYKGQEPEILKWLHLDVFVRYLGNNAFNFNFKFSFLYLIIPYIIFVIFLYNHYKNNEKIKAFLATSLVSFLAPVSWFIIFREHSHIHTHLNFVIWYVPFLIFAFIVYGMFLQYLLNKFSKRKFNSTMKFQS